MEYISAIFETIVSFFQSVFQFFIDLVTYAFDFIISKLVDLVVYLISVLPDPCCIAETVSAFTWFSNVLHSGGVYQWLAWVFYLVKFEYAIRIFLCALLARFILRRLPVVG